MKRKNILGLLVILILFMVIPTKVNADSFSLDVVCNDRAANGDIISCQLRTAGSGNVVVKNIHGRIVVSNNFSISSVEKSKYITSGDSSNGNFNFTSDSGVPVNDTIFTFYLKVNVGDDYKAYKDSVSVYVDGGEDNFGSLFTQEFNSNDITFDRFHESKLETLNVSSGTLSPSFDSNITAYTLTTNEANLTISGKLKDSSASSNIDLNGYKVNLEYGANNIEIKVTAQDKSSRIYKIIITRNDVRNDDTKLQLLTVNGEEIKLKDDVYKYDVSVNYDVEEVKILHATSSSTSKVKLEGDNKLKVGDNTFTLTVTSEKGSTAKYILNITRLEEEKSKDSTIKSIKIKNVKNLDLDFKSDKKNYSITIPKNISKLDFDIELNDENSKYKIEGNSNLKNDSKVIIKVTAEDETTTSYSFLIEKEKGKSNVLLIIIIIILLLTVIGVVLFLIIRNKKKNNSIDKDNKKDNEDENRDEDIDVDIDEVFKEKDEKESKEEDNIIVEEENKDLIDTKEFIINKKIVDNPEFEETDGKDIL